jgi:hypothetical protein
MSSLIHRYSWVPAFGLFLLYALSLPFAVARGGDFVHLWLGGRAAITRPWGTHLYTPATHLELLSQTNLPLDDYWGERFAQLGVFFYSPVAPFLYAPLGALPLNLAAGVMGALNLALILLVAWGLWGILQKKLPYGLLLLLLLLYPPIFFNYALGQNGIVSLAIVVTSGWLLVQGRPRASGLLLSLLLFKPNWLAVIGWWPLVQRRWQMLLGIALGVAGLVLASSLFWGIGSWLAYLQLLPRLGQLHETTSYVLSEQYTLLSLARRYGVGDGWGWLGMIGVWLTALVLLFRPSSLAWGWPWQLGLVWNTAVLLNPHLFHYDVLLSGASLLLALGLWQDLGLARPWRYTLIPLLISSYLAFPLMQTLEWHNSLPLPLFTTLLTWLWFTSYLVRQEVRENSMSLS